MSAAQFGVPASLWELSIWRSGARTALRERFILADAAELKRTLEKGWASQRTVD